jgi:protein TonB
MTRERLLGFVGSVSLQIFALGALGVSPYLSYENLPEPHNAIPMRDYVAVLSTPRAPVAQKHASRSEGKARNPAPLSRDFLTPTETLIEILAEPEFSGEGPEGDAFGMPVGIPDSVGTPPVAEVVPTPLEPIRPGGNVTAPRKRHHVNPVYPPVAAAARIQGAVVLEATIDENGDVVNLRVLRSIPLLDGAAIDAVRQWKYEPTLLNGRPVAILMSVSVRFELGR